MRQPLCLILKLMFGTSFVEVQYLHGPLSEDTFFSYYKRNAPFNKINTYVVNKIDFLQISGLPIPRRPEANWLGSLRPRASTYRQW